MEALTIKEQRKFLTITHQKQFTLKKKTKKPFIFTFLQSTGLGWCSGYPTKMTGHSNPDYKEKRKRWYL